MTDSGGSAGRDQIAHTERHETTHVRDELAHGEDHVLRVAALTALAVDRGPEPKALRVGDLVGCHEPGADGREGVRALALGRAAAVLHLERALGHVVHEAIRGHVGEGLRLVYPARVPAQHGHQFHFVVELGGARRARDRIVRTADGAIGLDEDRGLLGQWKPDLLGVVRVVEPDAHDLSDTCQGATEAGPALHEREPCRLDHAEAPKSRRRQDIRRDVLHHPREIPQLAFAIDEPRLFRAGPAVAYELHGCLPLGVRPPSAERRRWAVSWLYWRSLKRLP